MDLVMDEFHEKEKLANIALKASSDETTDESVE
jgi:hypothetical protein